MTIASTIAGSLPKPRWLASPDQLWAEWIHDDETRAEAQRDAVRLAVLMQEGAGIEIISDGEQTRRHFVTTFIEGLDGVDATNRETITIRRRYQASVPRVIGALERTRPVFLDAAQELRRATDHAIKFTLPGPMTMVDTLADHHYRDREEIAMVCADILNQEALDLVAAGIDVIQFDEPAFNVFLDEVADWGVSALELAAAGLSATTAVHICYGYGIQANIEWKQGLGPEWRQYEVTFPLLAESSIDQVSMEVAGSRVPLEVLDLLGDKVVQAGVIDVATEAVETPEQVAAELERILEHLPPSRIVASTNCGMVPLPRPVSEAKLIALGAGADLARSRLLGRLQPESSYVLNPALVGHDDVEAETLKNPGGDRRP
ncbi:MAG: methionine synthase [Acidimicrobiia bacterium]